MTIVTNKRLNLFGEIDNCRFIPNQFGDIAHKEWKRIPEIFPQVYVDTVVIMPNHIHGVIWINDTFNPTGTLLPKSNPKISLGVIIGSFKSTTSRLINLYNGKSSISIWQRNYYDHIICSDEELNRIRDYIILNPENWGKDEENIE